MSMVMRGVHTVHETAIPPSNFWMKPRFVSSHYHEIRMKEVLSSHLICKQTMVRKFMLPLFLMKQLARMVTFLQLIRLRHLF